MKIQVGANDGQTITIDLKKIDSDTLGLNGFNVNGKGETANTAATLKDMSGFTAAAAPGGTVGVTQYTDKSAVASSVDILNAVAGADGNKVTTSADVGFGTPAAAVTYTYNKDTNSYSAASDDISSANLAAFLNPQAGDTTKATVTIGGKDQDVNIDKSGNLTAAD